MLRTIERIFVCRRRERTLVGLLGRVVRLTSGLTSHLAGPGAFRGVRLARCLPVLIAGFVPWLGG